MSGNSARTRPKKGSRSATITEESSTEPPWIHTTNWARGEAGLPPVQADAGGQDDFRQGRSLRYLGTTWSSMKLRTWGAIGYGSSPLAPNHLS